LQLKDDEIARLKTFEEERKQFMQELSQVRGHQGQHWLKCSPALV
jgi:hypothetical protein